VDVSSRHNLAIYLAIILAYSRHNLATILARLVIHIFQCTQCHCYVLDLIRAATFASTQPRQVKEPVAGFSPQPMPVLAQFFEQLGTEQDIAVFAALSSADMNHHALAVDIADFQVCYFSTLQTARVERHEQSAMEGSASSIDELCDFFLAEDRWKVMVLFRIGGLGDAPGFLERLDVETVRM
jgi:hypothetical protein